MTTSQPGPATARWPGRADVVRGGLAAVRRPLAVGGAVAAATVVLALVDPHDPGRYGVCPFLLLTGHPCAACGCLRATHDLAHGDVAGAWDMNPLWVVTVPLLVAAWVVWLVRRVRGDGPVADLLPRRLRAALPWVTAAVVLGFTVLRNVPALAPALGP
jgi:hypothetical protein